MSTGVRAGALRAPLKWEPGFLLPIGTLLAAGAGAAATGENFAMLVLLGLAIAAAVGLAGFFRPHWIVFLLLTQVFLFAAFPLSGERRFNAVDLLMPAALVGCWFFTRNRKAVGPYAEEIEHRRAAFRGAGIVYYGVAFLSLIVLGLRGDAGHAFESGLPLARALEAALYFYLLSRIAQGRDGLRLARNGLFAGFAVAALVNLPAVFFLGVPRAGSVMIFGQAPERLNGASWALGSTPFLMTSPNEMGAACVLMWAVVLALRPRSTRTTAFLLVLAFVLLLATASRSGLVSWTILVLVTGLRKNRRWLWVLLGVPLVLVPFLPSELRDRLMRTVVLERGSFEAYSSLIRLYCWQTSWQVFVHNPLFGVGYLNFMYISGNYNALGVQLLTAENFFLQTAADLGVPGLLAILGVGVTSWRLGSLARRIAEPGSPAYELGATAPALTLAILSGNMTGDNLVGFLCSAQFVIYFTLVCQALRDPACRQAGRL